MRKLLLSLLGLGVAAACARAPAPCSVAFTVRPDVRGASVTAAIEGGPTTAWVGFGVGPGAAPGLVDQIGAIAGFDADGNELSLQPISRGGYSIETNGNPWQLTYHLDLRPSSDQGSFYRSSTRGSDYLVLVGSDGWARFHSDPGAMAMPPEARADGPVANATVRFQQSPESPDWRVVSTAWEEAPNTFAMRRHPVGSVFAVGPFEVIDQAVGSGLQIARHKDWDILPSRVDTLLGELLLSHQEMLGSANDHQALVLLSPMPDTITTQGGLRTAGMVRDQTLVVYAVKAASLPPDHSGIVEAMAVFLGHELFHLWVPSGVQVTRELSWLSEGWAMHMGRRAAVASGWVDKEDGTRRLNNSYRRYLNIGGYRAGSLPAASVGHEAQRSVLYLRGELVFRLLEQEWNRSNPDRSFERSLWEALTAAYDGIEPLDSVAIRAVLADLTDPTTVRRYVEGEAPLTPDTLGLAGR